MRRLLAPAAAGAAIVFSTVPAQAQTGGAGASKPRASGSSGPAARPVRRGRVYKRPLVDIEKQAQERRPGQVLPGDPPREKFAPPVVEPKDAPGATPAPPTPVETPISLPGDTTRDGGTGRLLKDAPTPIDPNSGPRGGAPVPATTPAPAPAPAPAPKPSDAASFESGLSPVPGSETASAGEAPDLPGEPHQSTGAVPSASTPVARSTATVSSITNTPADVAVRVVNAANAGVEWRAVGGAWRPLVSGDAATGRFEVRTGVDGEALIRVGDRVAVLVPPLSRVSIARRSADSPEAAFTIDRGAIELRATEGGGSEPVQSWVCTPDRTAGFESLPGVRIGYSAFSGTRVGPPIAAFR